MRVTMSSDVPFQRVHRRGEVLVGLGRLALLRLDQPDVEPRVIGVGVLRRQLVKVFMSSSAPSGRALGQPARVHGRSRTGSASGRVPGPGGIDDRAVDVVLLHPDQAAVEEGERVLRIDRTAWL